MHYGDIEVSISDHVALLEIQRPPNNFFDAGLMNQLADAFDALDEDVEVRALVLASQGKHFCAGNNFGPRTDSDPGAAPASEPRSESGNPLYTAAVRLFASKKPVISAIQGAAVGGGLGLAVMTDFRVVCPEARFSANFSKLGIHPGFGLTYTLPRIIGIQRAQHMFMTGARIDGVTAHEWGLADILTDQASIRVEALKLAGEIAENAPLAVMSVRATLRQGIADAVKRQTDHENAEQIRLSKTTDHAEGIRAVAGRRPGNFTGR